MTFITSKVANSINSCNILRVVVVIITVVGDVDIVAAVEVSALAAQ